MPSNGARSYYTDAEIISLLIKYLPNTSKVSKFLDSLRGSLCTHVLNCEPNNASNASIFNSILRSNPELLPKIIAKTTTETLGTVFISQNSCGFNSMDVILLDTLHTISKDIDRISHINFLLNSISDEHINQAIRNCDLFEQSRCLFIDHLLKLDDVILCNLLSKLDTLNTNILFKPFIYKMFNWNIFHLVVMHKKSEVVIDSLVKMLNKTWFYALMFQGVIRYKDQKIHILPLEHAFDEHWITPSDVKQCDNQTGVYLLKHLPVSIISALVLKLNARKETNRPFTDPTLDRLAVNNPGLYNKILARLRTEGTLKEFNTALVDIHRLDQDNAEYFYNTCNDFKPADLLYGVQYGHQSEGIFKKIMFFQHRAKEQKIYSKVSNESEYEHRSLKAAYTWMRESSSIAIPHEIAIIILHYMSASCKINRALTESKDLVAYYFLLEQAMTNFHPNTCSAEEKLEVASTILSYLASSRGIQKIIAPIINHHLQENTKQSTKPVLNRLFFSFFSRPGPNNANVSCGLSPTIPKNTHSHI